MANTLDEVIAQLTDIIDRARREPSRLGYFAALYRLVTINVKSGIQQGHFQDGARMERLDVAFANRYLTALEAYRNHQPLSECWRVAFDAAQAWRPLILQHLLLGINAHINFDLGVAAATVAPGAQLQELQSDFFVINKMLGNLVDQVQAEIGSLSPWIWLLGKIGGRTNDVVINFSIGIARSAAWEVAERLASVPQEQWSGELKRLDQRTAILGKLIQHPGYLMSTGLLAIRLRESSDVPLVIDTLSRP
jgi:hypothetical protein